MTEKQTTKPKTTTATTPPTSSKPARLIPVGDHRWAIVDDDLFNFLSSFRWYSKRRRRSWYAYTYFHTNVGPRKIHMHRFIAKTPPTMICHHRNRNSLDNRFANLVNMTKHAHHLLHKDNTLLVKYADPQAAKVKQICNTVPVKEAFNPEHPAIYIDDYPVNPADLIY